MAAPNNNVEKKPGFFSRMFQRKHVAPPADEAGGQNGVVSAQTAAPPSGSAEAPPVSKVSTPPGVGTWTGAAAPPPPPGTAGGETAGAGAADAGASAEAAEAPAGSPGFFTRLKQRLSKTKSTVIQSVRSAIRLSGKVDDELLDQVEGILIEADVGPQTTDRIIQRMKVLAKARRPDNAAGAVGIFKEVIEEIICKRTRTFDIKGDKRPYVVLCTGVNGTGKTTTIGKMAKRCTGAGLRCMLVAADTFRAAAMEQLAIWAERSGSLFVRGAEEGDPASVCFDGLQKARQEGVDVVFIDTAGRLHTKANLMEELRKIRRVIQKVIPDAPHETLLVLDATTGQNAIQQTRMFTDAVQVTGIVMTKLDGTAKGGVLIAIRDLFDIPITLIGIGEGEDDLRDFEPRVFVEALFAE